MEFTATLQQNGSTVASTTDEATFLITDGVCHGRLKLTASAGGGAGLITVATSGIPVPLGALSLADGGFHYFDASVGRYDGAVRMSSAGVLSFRVDNSTADLGTAPSFTIASTDTLTCSFRYPIA